MQIRIYKFKPENFAPDTSFLSLQGIKSSSAFIVSWILLYFYVFGEHKSLEYSSSAILAEVRFLQNGLGPIHIHV